MSSDPLAVTLPLLGLLGASDAIMAYGAFLAYQVWRGLAVQTYRQMAFWTSLLCVLAIVVFSYSIGIESFFNTLHGAYNRLGAGGSDLLWLVFVLVVAAWLDKTIATAIRLDFFRRDILGWRKLRPAFWAFMTGMTGFYALAFYFLPAVNITPPEVLGVGMTVSAFVPLGYASAALYAGRKRSKVETFRAHSLWFGLFVVCLTVQLITYAALAQILLTTAFFLAMGFCLYQMARHLVPVTKLASVPGDSESEMRRGSSRDSVTGLTPSV